MLNILLNILFGMSPLKLVYSAVLKLQMDRSNYTEKVKIYID
jgi:hypothetical protein